MAPVQSMFCRYGNGNENLILTLRLVQFMCFRFGDNKKGNENLILPWRLVQFLCFCFRDNKKRNENLILPLFCPVTINSNLLGEPRINIL